MAAVKYPTTWETVSTDSSLTTKRLRILGGWLVEVVNSSTSDSNVISVSDPNHEWEFTTDTNPE